ncbi:MAG: metallopeptidase TldD-related protein [Pseudorhodoferax sp.]
MQAIAAQADRLDLAGLYAGGDVLRGHRSSCGSAHWFGTQSFFLDYSLYEGRRAAKGVYAGTHWEPEGWTAQLDRTAAELALLRRPAQRVAPGAWRTWLAPQAFAEFIGMLGWRGLSADVWKQGRSPLKRLIEGEVQLSPLLRLDENFQLGLTPRFNSRGETSVERLPLLADGRLQNLLVSAGTAREYGLVANGADGNEFPRALDVAPGQLAPDQVLQALGTGLYVANLHYLNWSDPPSARVTGMTRYACFWVQDGEIAGPLAADLRWDQSLYEALGPRQLLALSRATEIAPATSTYAQRALGGMRTPGALIDGFHYTL